MILCGLNFSSLILVRGETNFNRFVKDVLETKQHPRFSHVWNLQLYTGAWQDSSTTILNTLYTSFPWQWLSRLLTDFVIWNEHDFARAFLFHLILTPSSPSRGEGFPSQHKASLKVWTLPWHPCMVRIAESYACCPFIIHTHAHTHMHSSSTMATFVDDAPSRSEYRRFFFFF